MRNGIVVAGHACVDVHKEVAGFPGPHDLCNIEKVSISLGGLVSNCGRDLARLDPELPVYACARIGVDGYGDEVLKGLSKYKNIDTSMIRREGLTSFTDVLSNIHTRERAFLTFAGACAHFCEEDVPVASLPGKIFHIGYVLLLDALDGPDEECGTKMARLLKHVQEQGLLTSVDMVTAAERERMRLLVPAIRYADILCVNEHECEIAAGVPLRDENDALIYDNIPRALARIKELGARKWAVIHAPEGGFGIDEEGQYHAVPGAIVPREYIGGTVGAGDAFTAGVLLGAHRDSTLEEALTYATASAVASLRKSDASEGVLPLEECLKLLAGFPRVQLP